jgi:hypothetical protein
VIAEKIQLTEEVAGIKCFAPLVKNLEWKSVSRSFSVISTLKSTGEPY